MYGMARLLNCCQQFSNLAIWRYKKSCTLLPSVQLLKIDNAILLAGRKVYDEKRRFAYWATVASLRAEAALRVFTIRCTAQARV